MQDLQYRGGVHAANYYDDDDEGDGYSARANAGYPSQVRAVRENMGYRLGGRNLPKTDQRHKLDDLHETRILEEAVPPGPRCFGDRILNEPRPPVAVYQLPRGTKSYDGSTNPSDWLTDYIHAVHVAGGNRRWAIR